MLKFSYRLLLLQRSNFISSFVRDLICLKIIVCLSAMPKAIVMNEKVTFIFGVPVPSDNRLFLAIVVFHIILGLICVISGLVAMLSQKTKKNHALAGKTYYWAMTVLFITVVITSLMRWPYNTHLFIVGTCAYTFTFVGQRLARKHKPNWTRLHTVCMGLSYVLLLTGFYVDNGQHLPFWKQFPQIFFWFFPAAIGLPIIIYVCYNHPLNRRRVNKT